ncbi:MAG: hypothetical protein ACT443_02875 [Gemmatimonadota bacterium]
MNQPADIVPVAFNLSTLVQRSVASLYSHLVTRPTGQALRLGIESQIGELGGFCVSVLDFSNVIVLDYSCADEVVAKLIQRFQPADRPCDAYIIARGLAEEHRDPIEEVLTRQRLALVAEIEGEFGLFGHASVFERAVWSALQKLSAAEAGELARHAGCTEVDVATALTALVERRTVLRPAGSSRFYSLTALLNR